MSQPHIHSLNKCAPLEQEDLVQEDSISVLTAIPITPATIDSEPANDVVRLDKVDGDTVESQADSEASAPLQHAEGVGIRLQQCRKDKLLRLEDVSSVTKISLSVLRGIEAQDYAGLPADAFTKGLVCLYAKHLGLEGKEMSLEFIAARHLWQSEQESSSSTDRQSWLSPKLMAEPHYISPLTTATALLCSIVTTITIFCLYTAWNPLAHFTSKPPEIQSIYADPMVNYPKVPERITSNG